MRAIAFDLGDTLVEYEGLPLSWEQHYPAALASLAESLGISPTDSKITAAAAILRRYNTRIHPRTEEVAFSTILREICGAFGVATPVEEEPSAAAFFRIFRQRLRCFPDTRIALDRLRQQGIKIGVFTDVPYGMPRELVVADVAEASLHDSIDVLLTSRDAGFRKPSPVGLRMVAEALDCRAPDLVHVGNEPKDVEVARALGCESILIDRHRHGKDWGQDRTINSLTEL